MTFFYYLFQTANVERGPLTGIQDKSWLRAIWTPDIAVVTRATLPYMNISNPLEVIHTLYL